MRRGYPRPPRAQRSVRTPARSVRRVPPPRVRHRPRRARRDRPLRPRGARGRPAVLLGPDPARIPRRASSSATTAAEQAGRCLENLQAVCAAAGASLADAVKITVYLRDMARLRRGQRGLRLVLRDRPAGARGDRRRRRCRATRRSSSTRSSRCRPALADAGSASRPRGLDERADRRGCARPPPGATARPARRRARAARAPRAARRASRTPVTTRPVADAVDALVVVRLGRVQLLAGRARRERAGRRRTSWSAPSNEPRARRWSWWPKRSGRCWCSVPPQRDVQQLHAAADPEQRDPPLDRAAREGDLERVALRHGADRRRVRSAP